MPGPIIAIVGRPNVGKSTLFNRLVGRRQAIVEDVPGTTRDRFYADILWEGREFTVVDTGGLEPHPTSDLVQLVKAQVEAAVKESQSIVFLVDGREGMSVTDQDIADYLRRSGKPVVLAVNKVDGPARPGSLAEFYQLGLGDPLPISAYHGRGTDLLLDRLIALLPLSLSSPPVPEAMKLAIVGRPNVGKSSLLNTLVGQERAIVHEAPGTTRDAIDTLLEYDGQPCLLIDTAGLRRPGRVEWGVEKYSMLRAQQAIHRADVALLIMEAPPGIAAQDTHIAGFIQKAFKGIVMIFNKWDLVERPDEADYIALARERLRFFTHAPILFISAKLGRGVEGVLPLAQQVYKERLKHIGDADLKQVLEAALAEHPPAARGKRLRFFRVTQTQVNPPTFIFSVNAPDLVHFSYQRYLENQLRQVFGFSGTPIRLIFKSRGRG